MRSFPKQLAASAVLLGLLAAGAALPATAASPLSAAAAITMPWATVAVESIAPGDYAATMTVGTAQQLSPDILPEKAAKRANVSFVSDNPNIVSVTSDGVAQAVGLGTAHVAATVGDQSCLYTITTEPDASMVVTEMDITLASNTITVGDTTSLSLAVLPTSAANYADVSLSSSNEGVATVNSFGKITGIAPGTATITATSGSVSASATIKVVASGSVVPQSLSLNTNYVVLKPGSSKTITGSVAPSTASQSLTFKSNDTKIATVNGSGVITGVSTGATSVIVSNGTVSSSVTVIVNRTASASSDGDTSGDGTPADETPTDPVVAAIENAASDTVALSQQEAPVVSSDALNALRANNKTLVVNGDGYSLRFVGSSIKNTSAPVDTALTFTPSEHGVNFVLNNGEALPGTVEVTFTGDYAAYSRIYLYNTVASKWQFLNAFKDNTLGADTAGEYLLTTENLRFAEMDWTFFIAGGFVMVGIVVAYIVVKKRYWFW